MYRTGDGWAFEIVPMERKLKTDSDSKLMPRKVRTCSIQLAVEKSPAMSRTRLEKSTKNFATFGES